MSVGKDAVSVEFETPCRQCFDNGETNVVSWSVITISVYPYYSILICGIRYFTLRLHGQTVSVVKVMFGLMVKSSRSPGMEPMLSEMVWSLPS